MKFIEVKYDQPGYLTLGDVAYGTVVTDVISHPQSIYMKVDKRSMGQGVNINVSKGHSLLVNLKTASLREVSGSTKVRVLSEKLELYPVTDITEYKKGF